VNAAGPWVDHVRRMEDPAAGTSIRLSKGVHALLRCDEPWAAALTIPQDDVRVSFAIPWHGLLLLGTTDTLYDGDPGSVAATEEDVAQVLAEAAVALEPALLARERVCSTLGGLRVLPLGAGGTAAARRETLLSRGRGGMLTVAGGKLTTYRRIGLAALGRLRGDLELHRLDARPRPLPGASGAVAFPPDVSPETRAHLLGLYGTLAGEVLAPAADDPGLLERLHPDGPDIAAQARYAATHEWALRPEDVLWRRTTLALRGLDTEDVRRRVTELR
jgi:glycerol-3-phosphate dehydrogenase